MFDNMDHSVISSVRRCSLSGFRMPVMLVKGDGRTQRFHYLTVGEDKKCDVTYTILHRIWKHVIFKMMSCVTVKAI